MLTERQAAANTVGLWVRL